MASRQKLHLYVTLALLCCSTCEDQTCGVHTSSTLMPGSTPRFVRQSTKEVPSEACWYSVSWTQHRSGKYTLETQAVCEMHVY